MHIDPEVTAASDERLALRVQRRAVDTVPVGLDHAEIEPLDALGFGVVLSVISTIVLGLAVNYKAAFLLANKAGT